MSFIISNEGRITQPNDHTGQLAASFNMDFSKGRLGTSKNTIKLINSADDADFTGYAAKILKYNGKTYAMSDRVLYANNETDNPLANWAEMSGAPDPGNTVTDAEVFDGKLLVLNGDDIEALDGSDWDDEWWTSTLGQAALTTGHRFFLKTGSDGNLYIVNGGNKVLRVDTSGTVTTTGDGTLDFSATDHIMTCMETNSTRLFIGTEHPIEGAVIEWDMSPSSNAANRIHKIGAKAVRCIAIWNDTPIAILSNGSVKYFDGTAFVDFPGVRFPSAKEDIVLHEDFIHPNGWAIIDDLPHFLVTGKVETGETEPVQATKSLWNMPTGVWCLDPNVGLYHRFAIGTSTDYGQLSVKEVGGLYALENASAKFLCSYEYYNEAGTAISTIDYYDTDGTQASRSFFATSFLQSATGTWKDVEVLNRALTSGDKIVAYYRMKDERAIRLEGVWNDTTHFHTTDDASDVEAGNIVMVKTGVGAGQIFRITSKETSAETTVLTMHSENTGVSQNDQTTIDVLNFKFMGEITSQAAMHKLATPFTEYANELQVLVEIQRGAGNQEDINFVKINT